MSEQQNTAAVQTLYEAFGRGDIQTILKHVTPETVWTLEGPANIPYSGTRRGPTEILGFFQALDNSCEDMKLSPETFVAQGDNVAMFGRFSGRAKATGIQFNVPLAHLFTLRDGKVVSYVNLTDTAALSVAHGSAASRRA